MASVPAEPPARGQKQEVETPKALGWKGATTSHERAASARRTSPSGRYYANSRRRQFRRRFGMSATISRPQARSAFSLEKTKTPRKRPLHKASVRGFSVARARTVAFER